MTPPSFEPDNVLALAAAVEALAGATSAVEVADIVRGAARRLSGADGIAVVLKEGDCVRYVDEDAVGPLWKGSSFPIESCISGHAILERRRLVIPDVVQDPRVPHHLYRPTFVRSCVMTPVGGPEPIACIGAYWASVREPAPAELASLDAIARATSVALENLRLRLSLEDALARAEASSRAKSDFLANMSHEIRTPLNGVIGAVSLLAGTPLSSEQSRLLAVVQSSGVALDNVLKDILDFARLQSRAVSLELGEFDVEQAVREVARLYELRFARKGIDFRTEIDERARLRVVGDRGALKQVLANLVHNALKFTDQGRVTLSATADGPNVLRFAVADTGVGVPDEVRERIFHGFEQADMSSTRAAGGLGLGLAVCRRLAELMDASLELQSRSGGGSVFTLTLPVLQASRGPAASDRMETPAPAPSAPVLVVDDHPTNRTVLSALLESVGIKSVEAVDGQQACEAFARESFCAVLMDIQMPIMDGLAATRRIRQLEETRGQAATPIIMVSANALPEHVEASRDAGADCHLAKPVSPAVLFRTLQSALQGELKAA